MDGSRVNGSNTAARVHAAGSDGTKKDGGPGENRAYDSTSVEAILAERIVSPNEIVEPIYRPNHDDAVHPSAAALFKSENARAAAQIATLPSARDDLVRARKRGADLMQNADCLRRDITALQLQLGPAWTLPARFFIAACFAVYFLMAGIGAFFIQDYLRYLDPLLDYSGLGVGEVLASLSLIAVSFIAGSFIGHLPPRLQKKAVGWALVIGISIFLAGLVALFGRSPAGAEAPDYAKVFGATAESSDLTVPEVVWLSMRLCGEAALLTVLKFLIDSSFKDRERTRTSSEESLKRIEIVLRDHQRAERRASANVNGIEALKNAYDGRLAQYIAKFSNLTGN